MKLLGVFFVLGLSVAYGQTININCNFFIQNTVYTCQVFAITVPDNESATINIGGVHMTNRTNADVRTIQILGGSIPFIVTHLFTTFPQATSFSISNGGLTRIQIGAFAAAQSLTSISIRSNNLKEIPANAFTGASRLLSLDVQQNQIEAIHETAFNGLAALFSLSIGRNNIRELHHNTFRALTSLRLVDAMYNLLESLDGRLFNNNPQVVELSFDRNRINAIGRNFLDNVTSLTGFFVWENICVNSGWFISGPITIDTIREGLTTCFNNAVEIPDPEDNLRRFILEIRGPFSLHHENGTEIVRV